MKRSFLVQFFVQTESDDELEKEKEDIINHVIDKCETKELQIERDTHMVVRWL